MPRPVSHADELAHARLGAGVLTSHRQLRDALIEQRTALRGDDQTGELILLCHRLVELDIAVQGHPAVRCPDASASRSVGSDTTSVANAVDGHRPGHQCPGGLVNHRGEVLDAAPGAATFLGNRNTEQAQGGQAVEHRLPGFGSPCSISPTASVAPEPAAQSRTNSRAANCWSVMLVAS